MVQHEVESPAEAYESYFRPAIFEPLAAILLEHARPQPGERVLDLACGTGVIARHVAPLAGTGGRITAVDINPAMIAVAQRLPAPEGATIEWMQGDGTALTLPDGAFDLAFCQQGMQFFPDRLAGAREMHRVLAPGGRAVVATWHSIADHALFAALADVEARALSFHGVSASADDLAAPFSLGDAEALRALLVEGGFSRVGVEARSIDARFASADRFIERMETAYSAVVPKFAEDRAAFEGFVAQVAEETRDIVARYRQGDFIVLPMHTNIAVAYR